MDGRITFLNVDLDLVSNDDLSELGKVFDESGVHPLHITKSDNGQWYATFETSDESQGPQPRIETMLAIVEALCDDLRNVWDRCTLREFNAGYDCGAEPWCFNQGLTAEVLGRMAAVGGAFQLTLYPDRPDAKAAEANPE